MGEIFRGTVVNGNKIGRRIGFPTANIVIDGGAALENGVYKATVAVGGERYGAIVNVGVKPTVGSGEKRIMEAHILGFDEDIYGQEIEVELGDFVREERKFNSMEELRAQIAKDKEEISKIK